MTIEDLKQQLLSNVDKVLECVLNGNTVEIKKNKNGLQLLEVSRIKLKNENE